MSVPAIGGRLRALLAPRPGRTAFSARLALIAALVTVVVELYGLSAATTVYIVFFTNKPDRAGSIKLALVMLVAVTISLVFGLLLADLALETPFRRIVAMTAFSVAMLYFGGASKIQALAPSMMMITGYYLDLIGSVDAGEKATREALYSWLLPAVPVAVGIVVNLLIAPCPRPLLQSALAQRVRAAARAVREGGGAAADACLELLKTGDADMRDHLDGARFEGAIGHADARALSRAVASTIALLSAAEVIARSRGEAAAGWRLQAADTLDTMAGMLAEGGYPIGVALPPPPADDVFALLHRAVTGFADGPPPPAAPRTGFLSRDSLRDPDTLAFAFKTTGAAMICYLIYQQLDWPGIHTCLTTCYVVALTSVGETVEKLTLRIIGAIVGALAGLAAIVWLMPHMTTIVPLALLIFVATFACAWIVAGGPRISYIGFQTSFAFYLSVLQKPYPAFDLSIGRDRVIGILFGNVVAYLVFTRVRPVSLARSVDASLARAATILAGIVRGTGGGAFGLAPGQVRSLVGRARQNLPVIRFEPRSVRPDAEWRRTRAAAIEKLDSLQSSALAACGHEPALAARLDAVAARLAPQAASPAGGVRHAAA